MPLKGVKFLRHERGLPGADETEEMEALLSGGSLGKGILTPSSQRWSRASEPWERRWKK